MAEKGSRKLLTVAVIWLLVLGLGAAAYKFVIARRQRSRLVESTSAQPLRDDLVTIPLALDSFSGYCVFRSEEMQLELASQGFQLSLLDDGADYSRRMEALRRREIPLAVFTIDALVKTSADLGDLPATIVMIIDETRGADAMIAYRKSVPNIDALNQSNARIVATRNSPSETLARVVLANFNLPRLASDPWIAADGAADVYQKFRKGNDSEPRAYVLWEPYVSKALENGDAHVIMDSSRFKGFIVDVLVAEREYLLKHEDRVEAVVRAYLRVGFARQQTKEGWAGLVADDARRQGEKLTGEQAARLSNGIWWKSTRENFAHFGLLPAEETRGIQSMSQMIRNITAVLVKTGAIASDPMEGSPNRLYYDKIARRLHDEKFHPGVGLGGESKPDTLRREADLPALTVEQWKNLIPVGTLQVEPIVFARGTARLTDQGRIVLEKLADTLKVWPQYYLIVRGHARAEGDMEANRRLAEERATATSEFLKGAEIPPQRIQTVPIEPDRSGGEAQSVTFVVGQVPY